MPLYEYLCPECKLGFQAIRSIRDRNDVLCPDCSVKADKLISTFGWSFGWTLSERCHQRFGPKEEWVKNV